MFWDILKLIFYLIIFAVIIFAAYYSCKKLAVHSSNFGGSRYMKIIDKIVLSKDAVIVLLKMGDKYLLVSQSPGGIGLIREFTEDEFEDLSEREKVENKIENPMSTVFNNILSRNIFLNNKKRRHNKSGESRSSNFFGFVKKEADEGEVLGRYEGDIDDVKDMDFNEILNRGMSRSGKKTREDFESLQEFEKNENDIETVDEMLKNVGRKRKNFDLRKEEKNAAETDKE